MNTTQLKDEIELIDLRPAKKYLETGDLKKFAKEEGITPQMVSHYMKHGTTNESFAIKVLEKAERIKALKERFKNLK